MPVTLDLTAVRHFTDDLAERVRRCDNGEGMECSTIDDRIRHLGDLCRELLRYVIQWARAIFAGTTEFDPAVERVLKDEIRRLLHRAEQVAAEGRARDGECYVLKGLPHLHWHVANFQRLLKNWVSPRLAVSPAPRTVIPPEAERQMLATLERLSAAPTANQSQS